MRILRYVLILLALLAVLVLVPSENTLAEIVPIPLNKTVMADVNEQYYLSDLEYEDPSLHIVIEKGRANQTNYMVAYITVADASQLRTALATPNGQGEALGTSIARRVHAVMAINGDYFSSNRADVGKYIVRQGELKKAMARGRMGHMDALFIDENGDLTILPLATEEDVESFEGTVVNSFFFGPGLVINGELVTDFSTDASTNVAVNKSAQRMCIAQLGPLSYMCVAAEGPEDQGSVGMTIPQFAELVYSLGDVQNAYNLDGGSSCTLIFRSEKINSPNNPKRRNLCDMLYFASAWQDTGTTSEDAQ